MAEEPCTGADAGEGEPPAKAARSGVEVATFAMGCFWGPQKTFDHVPGVTRTMVGYTGGESVDPTYKSVCSGDGHTEALKVEFDPSKVDYADLLEVFYRNCRAESSGKPQYKSAIWVHSEEQREKAKAAAEARGKLDKLDIEDPKPWYDAEDYHQKYYLGKGRAGT